MQARKDRNTTASPFLSSLPVFFASFLTGGGCLIFELVWSRYLQLIFGVSVYAIATVLTCFMLGMAIGAWHLGTVFDRAKNPKRLLTIILLVVAGYIALSPLLYHALVAITASIARGAGVRLVLSFIVLILPTYLMGGTFPAVIKLLTRSTSRIGRDVAMLYAINTLGGAVGAMLTGFVLIRSIGLQNSLFVAAALNIIAAILIAKVRSNPTIEEPKHKPATSARPPDLQLLVIIFITGFTSLAYEVYWTRILTFFFKDSIYDLTIVLCAFLCGMVIGSVLANLFMAKRAAGALVAIQFLIGLSSLFGLVLISYFPYWINDLQTNTAMVARFGESEFWLAGNAIRFGYAFALMLVPTCLFGAAFPLIARISADTLASLGRKLGIINSIETLGAALGSLAAGFAFVPLMGLQHSIMLTAALNVVAGILLMRNWMLRIAMAIVAMLFVAILPTWDKLRMSTSFLDQNMPVEEVLSLKFYKEDAHGLTSVVELVPRAQKFLVTNRLFSQNNSTMLGLEDHRRLGQIPMLIHPNPQHALAVGLGAGITLRGVNECSPLSIDCVEISPTVIEAARYFETENAKVLDDPKVRMIVDDARHHMSTSARQYDAIILDIFHPMSGGSSTVFSREYYQLCRNRLAPGGLVCQWLPMHQLSLVEIKTIVATFQSIFPHTSLWFGMIGPTSATLGIVGSESPLKIDIEQLAARMKDANLAKQLREVNLQSPPLLLSHFIMADDDVAKFCDGYPMDTDNRPIVEFAAPKLSMQAYRLGASNLLELSRLMENINISENEELSRHVNGKKTIIEGMTYAIDDPQARHKFYEDALAKDRENEDLIYVIRQLEDSR